MINVNYFFFTEVFSVPAALQFFLTAAIYIKPEGINLCGTDNL